MIKNISLLILFVSSFTIKSFSQNFWIKTDAKNDFVQKKEILYKKNFPNKYSIMSLDLNGFKNHLAKSSLQKNNNFIIQLPNAKGLLNKFIVRETSCLAPELAKKFPMIKSYSAQGIDNPSATAKISFGTDGFHTVIFSGKESTIYIDSYTKDKKKYIVYKRSELNKSKNDFECKVEEVAKRTIKNPSLNYKNANDGKLRTYRLAIVATGEYSQFHIDRTTPTPTTDTEKKAAVLSAMNTSMTRINGVFERDLAVRMTIVDDNDKIIFLDGATDNLTNDNEGVLIDEIQSVIDNAIGNSNYDIGHAFCTANNAGLAALQSACSVNSKAQGVTGRLQPIGDPFDIDFVSHEMGHQFGATHTQNNDCNRWNSTAVEPGSASTIMGYAGICSPNVQNNSDDHFHAVSIAQMWSHITGIGGCAVATDTGNNAPTANAGNDYNIPKSTPFVLRGSATDNDGMNGLTYNWEQIDNGIAIMPPESTNTGGPMFRSLPSKTTPNRYLPALTTVVTGNTSTTWEVLPSVARELNFAFTVRDNHSGGGNTDRDDIKITVTDAEAFTVTAPNTAVSWDTGSTQTITWNKSTTDQTPINCSKVNIKLSVDGGITFPIMLRENTDNDGTENIVIPNNATSSARIMVEAADNVFYNVNSTNFTINSTTPTFIVTNQTSEQVVCNSGNNSVNYVLNFDFVNGFSETATLSATGAPSTASVTFNPTTINTDGNITMTISNLDGVTQQDYTIEVIATSTSLSQKTEALLKILGPNFSSITLSTPSDNDTGINITPTFEWLKESNATSYIIQVSTDNNFSNIIINETSVNNSYTSSVILSEETKYYWRVKPVNECGEGTFSNPFSFTSETPEYCSSTFTDEVGGSEHITNVTFNTINNTSGNNLTNGYEDFTDVTTSLIAGATYQISVTFDTAGFRDHCYVFIDWNRDFVFDNQSEKYDLGTHTDPISTATFDITVPGNAVLGKETRMRVIIEFDPSDGACDSEHKTEWGETEDYSVIIDDGKTSSIQDLFKDLKIYPVPSSNGKVTVDFRLNNKEITIFRLFDFQGRLVSMQNKSSSTSLFSQEIELKVSSGLYLLQIQNAGKTITKKILIK